ncbi:glycoside hydrolase family 127 protein [Microlunatus sp. GCM10028923]|uniref:glycoside hydrolase family 127 protein n=1 Tax=Microlunatus sp. GCM10028923 TaxID=3273400 RepID=UPI00361187CB
MAYAGPVRPTETATVVWHPVAAGAVTIAGGPLGARQAANRAAAIPSGLKQLREAKNVLNLEIAAGRAEGEAVGPIFADSDVHKWLEAAAWEYGRSADPALLDDILELTGLLEKAQADDGYLDSVVQLRGLERYSELEWSHEHYCAGHLIQAAVAYSRTTGRAELLDVARRVADHLVATFGPGRNPSLDGHPVIEMALVELYRETGERSYLDLAKHFVDTRGRGTITGGRDVGYYSDRVPVREATTVEGHSVRAVYLAAGAADVAAETGDAELLAALETQFASMITEKEYLTGGLGGRWEGEAFGDPFELPNDRAYAETCATIGGIQWAWRMLLATGKAGYADQIERMIYNGFISGVSQAGTEYFYVNTLHLRDRSVPDHDRTPARGRVGWFACACCPPNVMRTFSSLEGYLASTDADGLQLHQYLPGTVEAGGLKLTVATDYPWQGKITITVDQAGSGETTIGLRVPAWAEGATLTTAAGTDQVTAGEYASVRRTWQAGDQLVLDLPLTPRLTAPHPRVDASRGCLAIERGPLVYALEQADQAESVAVDDLRLDPAGALAEERREDLLGGVTLIKAAGSGPDGPVELVALPYHLWANRGPQPMRVWIPLR